MLSSKKWILCISLKILLLIVGIKGELSPNNVLLAINCGGKALRDSKGIYYENDKNFIGGQESDFGANYEFKLTDDSRPYQTERWSNENFKYILPLKQPGKYVLILKFSEVYFNSAGEKIFDIGLGNVKVVNKLDIFAKAGKATAYNEYIEMELKNGKIYFQGKIAEDAYSEEKREIVLNFIKGEKDNPKINAILIVKGTLADTDYEDYREKLEDLERKNLEKEGKFREFQKKSNDNDYEDFEDDFVDTDPANERVASPFNPSFLLLTSLTMFLVYHLFIKGKRRVK